MLLKRLYVFLFILGSSEGLFSNPDNESVTNVSCLGNISFASDEFEPEKVAKTRGKGSKWSLVQKFASDSEAERYIKHAKIWAKRNQHETDEGVKITYRCNKMPKKDPQCSCKMYLLKLHTSIQSKMYISGEHTHENARKTDMDDPVRAIVLSMTKKGMKPAAIRKYIGEEIPHSTVPSLKCIYNYLHRTNFKTNAEHKVSIGEMVEWLEAKSCIPEYETTPYVLNYECSEPLAESKFFRFAMTSKELLQKGTKYENLARRCYI